WCLRSASGDSLGRADRLLVVSIEQGLAQGRAWAKLFRGRCVAAMGRPEEAIALLTAGLAEFGSLGISVGVPMFLTSLAEAYGMAGRPEAGLAQLTAVEETEEFAENRWSLPETLR